MTSGTRRTFLKASAVGALSAASTKNVLGANDDIVLGLIGTGGRGKALLKAITNLKGYRVAATCDLVEDRAKQGAAICEDSWPNVKTYTNLRAMLDREKDLDAVLVATEEGNHAKCAIPVLSMGLHCFCEKPVDTTVEKVNQFTRVARKSKGMLQFGFQRHYVPSFTKGMDLIHSGAIGDVTFMQGKWHWEGDVGGRYLDLVESGGWFLAQACHHADVMLWAMDYQPPVQCAAAGAITNEKPNAPKLRSENHSAITFQFAANAIFSYTHIMNCCEPFTGEQLWVYGQTGGINLPEGKLHPREGMGEPKQYAEGVSHWGNGTYEELEAFGQHIRNGEESAIGIEQARLSTIMGIMGRKAMYDAKQNQFGLSTVRWDDLDVIA